MTEPSLWSFISHASPVVKFVILILLGASIASWTIIIQRILYFKKLRRAAQDFEQNFWSGADLNQLYKQLCNSKDDRSGLSHIFYAGFKEHQRVLRHQNPQLDTTQRAMRISTTQETNALEKNLSFLATVGSTSPYVGLFGTVWGIMSAFRALGIGGQATIAMVAPGIAEALIATAIGLFAAIPAVIAYNRLNDAADHIALQYEIFQEELTTLFEHQANQVKAEEFSK
jgi:biopolymer transport protein TolQ